MEQKSTYLRGDDTHPFHLSIGQVIVKDGKIVLINKPNGVVTLPRETTYIDETYSDCLIRGATEEIGVTVTPIQFLGSFVTSFNRSPEVIITKTTLYFLTEYEGDSEKKPELDEMEDKTTWEPFSVAIELLKKTGENEDTIVERAEKLQSKNDFSELT